MEVFQISYQLGRASRPGSGGQSENSLRGGFFLLHGTIQYWRSGCRGRCGLAASSVQYYYWYHYRHRSEGFERDRSKFPMRITLLSGP